MVTLNQGGHNQPPRVTGYGTENGIPAPHNLSGLASTCGTAYRMNGRVWMPGEREYWNGNHREKSQIKTFIRWQTADAAKENGRPILSCSTVMTAGHDPSPWHILYIINPILSFCERWNIPCEVPFIADGDL